MTDDLHLSPADHLTRRYGLTAQHPPRRVVIEMPDPRDVSRWQVEVADAAIPLHGADTQARRWPWNSWQNNAYERLTYQTQRAWFANAKVYDDLLRGAWWLREEAQKARTRGVYRERQAAGNVVEAIKHLDELRIRAEDNHGALRKMINSRHKMEHPL